MTKKTSKLDLNNYIYPLKDNRIAKFPLEKRDDSKLLIYRKGEIEHNRFFNLKNYISEDSLLIFNNTKVIPARLYFQKATGAVLEIFILHPDNPKSITQSMESQASCSWQCMIRNKKKWKNNEVLKQKIVFEDFELTLEAELIEEEKNIVKFTWDKSINFAEILKKYGEMPLPPYLKRKATEKDYIQYQTIYSQEEGAVAAPTAGLHFTENVLSDLKAKGIQRDFITLHVGAGTFQPIKNTDVISHNMHKEQIVFTKENIENILEKAEQIIAVGTTSLRALESLYWFGVKVREFTQPVTFFIEKLFPYQSQEEVLPSLEEAMSNILEYMEKLGLKDLLGETEIFIFPSYQFKVCKGLITNYHLPASTLILLIASFIGEDWRKVYQEALDNDYRFLSYGDSSLLLP